MYKNRWIDKIGYFPILINLNRFLLQSHKAIDFLNKTIYGTKCRVMSNKNDTFQSDLNSSFLAPARIKGHTRIYIENYMQLSDPCAYKGEDLFATLFHIWFMIHVIKVFYVSAHPFFSIYSRHCRRLEIILFSKKPTKIAY